LAQVRIEERIRKRKEIKITYNFLLVSCSSFSFLFLLPVVIQQGVLPDVDSGKRKEVRSYRNEEIENNQ
jgi:hypothetical protein